MRFLIAYDIADPKRLRQLALFLERHAVRVQKSVFLFEGLPNELEVVMRGCLAEIDIYEDVVQSWPIAATTALGRVDLGRHRPGFVRCLIVGQHELLFLEDLPCSNG